MEKLKVKNVLKQWEKSTQELTDYFVKKYFDNVASDVYWISDEIGGCLAINDYFFSLDRIVEAIKYRATKKELFDFCDLELKHLSDGKQININFRNYLRQYDKNNFL